MANRSKDKNCIEVRVCVDDEINREIEIELGHMIIEGIKPAKKPEAAYRLYKKLLRQRK